MVKIPNIRFAGFSDEWVENQLGSLIKIERQHEIKKEKLTDTPEGYYVLAMRTFSKEGYIDFSKPYWLKSDIEDKEAFLLPGEFAIIDADMDVSLPKIGKVLINSYNKKFVLAAHVRKVNVQNNVNSYFMYGVMRTDQLLRRLKNEASGSIAQGLLDKNIYKQNVYIPTIFEQQQIGEFFWTLEETIARHQRKLDLLKDLKKGYLQKMFPKNGAKVPEWRFPGFTDDWEQRKLSDIVVRLTKSSNNNQLPKVEFEDIIAGEGRLNKDISRKFDDRKGTLFEPDNILYGKLRPYLKNWLFSDFKGIALGDFWVFKSKNSEPKFVYSLIQADNYQRVANDTSGTKMPRSDWKKVSSSNFSIPTSLEEQQKIGSFFKQLENTITLHQRKLDLLKDLKKGLLQQMFV